MKYKYLTIILAIVPMLAVAEVLGKTLTPIEPTKCELASIEDCDNEIRSFWSATDKVEKVAMKRAIAACKVRLNFDLQDKIWLLLSQYVRQLQLDWDNTERDAADELMESKCRHAVEGALTVCSESNILPDEAYECGVCLSIPATYAEVIAGYVIAQIELDISLISPEERELYTSAYENYLNRSLKRARSDNERDSLRKSLDRLHREKESDSDFDESKFRESYKKELERYRQQKKQDTTP